MKHTFVFSNDAQKKEAWIISLWWTHDDDQSGDVITSFTKCELYCIITSFRFVRRTIFYSFLINYMNGHLRLCHHSYYEGSRSEVKNILYMDEWLLYTPPQWLFMAAIWDLRLCLHLCQYCCEKVRNGVQKYILYIAF